MTAPAAPIVFDRSRLRKRRDRAVEGFDGFDFLHKRAADELVERLEDVSRTFPLALDLSSGAGGPAAAIKGSGKAGHLVAMALSPVVAARCGGVADTALAGDVEAMPFREDVFDLAVSLLDLHWTNDLPGALIQIRQCLKPDGLFLGALLGAGTLNELRQSLLAAEAEVTGGASARISPLPGLQDMAGLLQRAGFALPVADVDHVTVRYASAFDLLRDLKGMGERAAFAETAGRGLSPRILTRMAEIYAERFSDPDGRVRATFEMVWLSGWAPAPHQPKPLKPGSGRVSLADAVKGSASK